MLIGKKQSSQFFDQSSGFSNTGLKFMSKNEGVEFSSNNTLKYFQGANKPTYYLTAYVRAKVISISGINYRQMTADLNCQFFIDISVRGISKQDKNTILKQGIRLSFQTDKSMLLTRQNADVTVNDDEHKKIIQYTIRKFVKTRLVCDGLFWSPFEVINCQIGIKLNKVKIQLDKQKQDGKQRAYIQYHFNMMDHYDTGIKLTSSSDSNFGLFQIATAKLLAKYTTGFASSPQDVIEQQAKQAENSLQVFNSISEFAQVIPGAFKKKKGKSGRQQQKLPLIKRGYGKQQLQQFNVALFQVPLYKKPVVANLTIFLPLLMLAITNLGIFYQQPDLHKRIVSIASIMVSFVALVPVIRQQIPPTPIITLVQILVFAQAITCIFALFDSLRVLGADEETWDFDGSNSILFIISLIITILINTIVAVLSLVYNFKWKKSYVSTASAQLQDLKVDQELKIFEWSNPACDAYFMHFYKSQTITIIQDVQANADRQAMNLLGYITDKEKRNMVKQRMVYENQLEPKIDSHDFLAEFIKR